MTFHKCKEVTFEKGNEWDFSPTENHCAHPGSQTRPKRLLVRVVCPDAEKEEGELLYRKGSGPRRRYYSVFDAEKRVLSSWDVC